MFEHRAIKVVVQERERESKAVAHSRPHTRNKKNYTRHCPHELWSRESKMSHTSEMASNKELAEKNDVQETPSN
jgi:hypothetical protein